VFEAFRHPSILVIRAGQGLCTGARRPQLSNALDVIVGH
jgi:hypothetical protein